MVRLAIATHLSRHDASRAACMFFEVLRQADNPYTRNEVITILERTAGTTFELTPDQDLSEQEVAQERLKRWLREKGCGR